MHRDGFAFVAFLLVFGLVSIGCKPSIGAKCTSSTDCSISGDRLCDTTQPGGYCTVFNCEPGNCPDEAQCVAFDQQVDPACYDPNRWSRFERTFCMKRCESNGDCRTGYVCAELAQSNAWGASIVDLSPEGTRICISAITSLMLDDQAAAPSTAICHPYDGGFDDVNLHPAPADATADAGSPEDAGLDASADVALDVQEADSDASVSDAATDASDVSQPDVVDASASGDGDSVLDAGDGGLGLD